MLLMKESVLSLPTFKLPASTCKDTKVNGLSFRCFVIKLHSLFSCLCCLLRTAKLMSNRTLFAQIYLSRRTLLISQFLQFCTSV